MSILPSLWKLSRRKSELVEELESHLRTASDDMAQIADVLQRAVAQADPKFRVSTVTTQTQLIETQTIRERLLAALLLGAVWSAALLGGATGTGDRDTDCPGRGASEYCADCECADDGDGDGDGRSSGGSVWERGLGAVCGSLLYGVKGTDMQMMVLPGLVLLGAAALAALPAVMRRALRIDPAIMLRAE